MEHWWAIIFAYHVLKLRQPTAVSLLRTLSRLSCIQANPFLELVEIRCASFPAGLPSLPTPESSEGLCSPQEMVHPPASH